MGNHILAMRKFLPSIVTAALVWSVLIVPGFAQGNSGGTPLAVQVGDWLTVKPRVKIQLDLKGFRPKFDDQRAVFHRRRIRLGVDGTFLRDFAYTMRIETRTTPEFRDLFVRYQRLNSFQLQAGRFKIPFSLDQLADSGELDFVQRSRIGSLLAPGRDSGAMVLGETAEGAFHYSAGVFRQDGKNSELDDFAGDGNEPLAGGVRTIAARAVVQPLSFLSSETPIHNLAVGAAFTHSNVETGLSSLPGVTASDQVFFPRMYVSGTRVRRGAELSARVGPLAIKSEFIDVRDQRLGQGLDGEDLPDLRARGWYVSATQPLLGRLDDGANEGFLGSILPGPHFGLLEAAVRYEAIRFGGVASNDATPSGSPRATNVAGNDDRVWTFGANWHASRYTKLQFNASRETLSDPARTPVDGVHSYWTLTGRLQVYF